MWWGGEGTGRKKAQELTGIISAEIKRELEDRRVGDRMEELGTKDESSPSRDPP